MDNSKCKNYGACCGPVPIGREEKEAIRIYLLKHPDVAEKAKAKTPTEDFDDDANLVCIFRDNETKSCLIYPVRPNICKAYTCKTLAWKKELSRGAHKKYCMLVNEVFCKPEIRSTYIALHDHKVPKMKLFRKM